MKIRGLYRLFGAALALSFAGFASAGTITYSYPGAAAPIPDLSTVVFDIVIGDPGVITDLTVHIDLTHDQVGDLHITLTNIEDSVTQDIVFQAGGANDNTNYSGVYSFNDVYTGNIWTAAGNENGTNTILPAGDYFASTDLGAQVLLLDAFGGLDSAGTWRLSITDLKNTDTGTLNGWSLDVTTGSSAPPSVPEPSTYLLFGLGLGVLASMRRRRDSRR